MEPLALFLYSSSGQAGVTTPPLEEYKTVSGPPTLKVEEGGVSGPPGEARETAGHLQVLSAAN